MQLKRGDPYSLAVVLVELHRRCPPVPGGRPIRLDYHVSDTPDPVSETPVLELEPCPPPRSDAELVGVMKAHGWTLKRIREATGISETRLSRVANDPTEHLSDENRVALRALVAEIEREISCQARD